ncbi:EscS/YscS/HrcS family type III secretion system export apparatus protein [Solemya pervernicosa gill symbiont]|uniref:Flagellar biosynthetic protein FliQ n=1 Tax=Solemya pervernicosa gill symbiont TaxID=642797 RepID=A0A1T2LAK8_9GAMM|nr:flagellar biosynthesis protein FliQ [Solemya pervernicosa gill symbiont]OOZ42135.1 EscS/YscS/HrcS family type III secretion system export apparatus protein [Solemya pervernicosa gill symbiont]
MTPDIVVNIIQETLIVTALLAAPLLLSALAIGLLVSVFQAATSIQEMTLSFIPKLIILALALMMAGPWMLRTIMGFATGLIQRIPELIG